MSHPVAAVPISKPWGFGSPSGGGAPVASPLAPSGANGEPLPPVAKTVNLYLPEIYPIPEAQNFNPSGQIATAAVEAKAVPGCTIILPPNTIGVIRGLSLYIDNMLVTTNVQFSLVVNGGAPAGFGNLTMFPRVAPFVSNTFDTLIRVENGATIAVTFSNLDGGTYLVGASFSGWFWPQAAGERWTAGR